MSLFTDSFDICIRTTDNVLSTYVLLLIKYYFTEVQSMEPIQFQKIASQFRCIFCWCGQANDSIERRKKNITKITITVKIDRRKGNCIIKIVNDFDFIV